MFILLSDSYLCMADLAEILRNLYLSVVLLLIIYVIGTFFYHNVEGWSYLKCIYFITITIATVGYGDVVPETDLGKIFTVVLIITGVSIFLSLVYSISAFRERTFDQQLVSKLSIFRNLTSIRSDRYEDKKKPPRFLHSLGMKIGEV